MFKKTFILCVLFAGLALPAGLMAQTSGTYNMTNTTAVPSTPTINKSSESAVKVDTVSPSSTINETVKVNTVSPEAPTISTQSSAESSATKSSAGSAVPLPISSETSTTKCGVNTFRFENDCGISVYKNMYVQCHDGYEEEQGGYSSCKSSELWQEYAKEVCLNRCSSNAKLAPSVQPLSSTSSFR